MQHFFTLINTVTDLLVMPFGWAPPLAGIFLVSFIAAVVLLVLFKFLSDQERIAFHKNRIFGYILEIGLFRDQFKKTIVNQGLILKHNLIYFRYVAVPLLVMIIPVMLTCMQLENRIGYRPLAAGDRFNVQVQMERSSTEHPDLALDTVTLEPSTGIVFETPLLRIPEDGSIHVRARLAGNDAGQFIRVMSGSRELAVKRVVNSDDHRGFSPETCKALSLAFILNTGEAPIRDSSPVSAVRIDYPKRAYPFLVWRLSPVIYFFILSLGFGFLVKPLIRVNI